MHPVYFTRKVIDKFSLLRKKKVCNICHAYIFDYLPLPDHYTKNFKKFGFPHTQKGAFETIDVNHFFCPQCYSMDRERLYAWYFKKNIFLTKDQSLLDFAPSNGLRKWLKLNYDCKYVSADLFMDDVDVKTDIQNMNVFSDETFDFIICSHVMEHVPNDQQAMNEIFRVLKKNGRGIVMTPILRNFESVDEDHECKDVAERWQRFGQDDHIRLYSKNIFMNRLEQAGFRITQITDDQIPDEDKIKLGLPENTSLYIVTK